MNDVDGKLCTMLVDVLSDAVRVKELIISELPEVIQQLLFWKSIESAAYCLISIVLSVVTYYGARFTIASCKSTRYGKESYDEIVGLNAFWAFMLIPIIAFMSLDWLQILVAPKVYLIEYAALLAK